MNQQINISNIINVNISQVPLGIMAGNINVGLFLTTDTPSNSNPYTIYYDSVSVGNDYGTTTSTYNTAVNIFAQQPNILAGNGALIIAPYAATNTSATQGEFVTTNISTHLSNLIAVTNGVLKVTIDGIVFQLGGLNFSSCTTLANVASVLQNALSNAIVTATTTQITIQSKLVGSNSTILLEAGSLSGTDLTTSTLLNVSAGTDTAGANAILNETPVAAIARLLNLVSFYWVITNLEMSDTQIETIATTVQSYANSLIFLHHFASQTSFAGVGTTIVDAKQNQTRCLYYGVTPTAANLMKACYCGRAFSVNFASSNSAITMQLQSLNNLTPDPTVNQAVLQNANNAGMDVYANISGYPSIYTSEANNFYDNVLNEMWLKINLQIAGFNALATVGTKIPQTEAGMVIMKNALEAILIQGVVNNIIGTGVKWTAATFGNQIVFLQNVFNNGYYIYSSPIATQNSTQRALRQAPPIQIAVQFSGAIQSVVVNVNVNV